MKKGLKIGLFVLGGIIAVFLIVAAFVKKEFMVERSIVINKPVAEVFNYIKYLKNQTEYGVWEKKDTAMKETYEGVDGTVGFTYKWDSKNKEVGKGQQVIKNIDPEKRIDIGLTIEGWSECPTYMITEAVDLIHTKVIWGIHGNIPYPLNIMRLFIDMDNEMGKDFAQSLQNLSEVLTNSNK